MIIVKAVPNSLPLASPAGSGLVAGGPLRFAVGVEAGTDATSEAADARARIETLATAAGFDLVRFAPATALAEARGATLEARASGRLADLHWMTDEWITRAADPRAFLAGAQSVALLAITGHAPDPVVAKDAKEDGRESRARGRIARYARGRDYHRLFESKLRRLARAMREELGAETRWTVDYGPLLERPLAARAGLGWLGKSTMLLAPGFGPWVLLGAIATTLPIAPDAPLRKTCGACTRCIVACPTGAIAPDGGVLDARLCISYHTIESREPIPRDLRARFGDWIFGCDDCLDACPVGARNDATHPDLAPTHADDAFPPLAELLALDDAAFRERFRGRAVQRATRDGFLRNVCVALGNVGTAEDVAALIGALGDGAALVRGHAASALGAIARRTGTSGDDDGSAAAGDALRARLAVEQEAWVREEIAAALETVASSAAAGAGKAAR